MLYRVVGCSPTEIDDDRFFNLTLADSEGNRRYLSSLPYSFFARVPKESDLIEPIFRGGVVQEIMSGGERIYSRQ